MREILFRGKKWETSVWDEMDWVYGSLIDSGNHEQVAIYPWVNGASSMSVRQLVYARMESVKHETVGQYTGLTDKDGKKIFEGDIVKAKLESGNFKGFEWPNMKVGFKDGAFCLIDNIGRIFAVMGAFAPNINFEVVGNFYDNSELLGVKLNDRA